MLKNRQSFFKSDSDPLLDEHKADLEKSTLDDETIKDMRISSSLMLSDYLKSHGVKSAYRIPYTPIRKGCPQFWRDKLFPPIIHKDGKEQKYDQPQDGGCRLFVFEQDVDMLKDSSIPLFIVEGEKKAAALRQLLKRFDIPGVVVGIGGIWNTVEKDSTELIKDFNYIALHTREIFYIPDSDIWGRMDLQIGVIRTCMLIVERGGTKLKLVELPAKTKGLDDYLADLYKSDFQNGFPELMKCPQHPITGREWTYAKEKYKAWKADHREAILEEEDEDDLKAKGYLQDIEPWGNPVTGNELLNGIDAVIERFIVVSGEELVAETLWTVFAHAIEAFTIAPFLVFTSPVQGCGKSLNQTIISKLTPKKLHTGNITHALLFRLIEKYRPTLFVDEQDGVFDKNDELRAIVNSSYFRPEAVVPRLVGDKHEETLFSTWSPKCIALIGNLPHTTASRSIVIHMQRKKRQDKREKYSDHEPYPEMLELQRKAARWAIDNLDALCKHKPTNLPDLSDRDLDNWIPLFTIADIVGGDWPKLARRSAQKLCEVDETETRGIELLRDIQQIFAGDPELAYPGCDTISSHELVQTLNGETPGLAEKFKLRPWRDYNHGSGLTPHRLSKMLEQFGVFSRSVQVKDRSGKPKQARGYQVVQFQDSFERYLT